MNDTGDSGAASRGGDVKRGGAASEGRAALRGWTPPARPTGAPLAGRWAALERLSAEAHAADLYRANAGADAIFEFMPYGPFASSAAYHRWVRDAAAGDDPMFYAIRNLESGHWEGLASYLNIVPEMGRIEVGWLTFSPALQRTRAATEAMYLMMRGVFEAGYRRCEWKCDARNIASRRAAQRLGFSYEGTFRSHMVVKGKNRDTAWFAATDDDWPALKEAFAAWLAPSNFDTAGQQLERLGDLTGLVRVASDPLLRR